MVLHIVHQCHVIYDVINGNFLTAKWYISDSKPNDMKYKQACMFYVLYIYCGVSCMQIVYISQCSFPEIEKLLVGTGNERLK